MKQVLDFIKAHTTALACGVVALLAMIAYFAWPLPGMFADLQSQVDARKQTYDSLNTLLTQERTLPPTDITTSEGVSLGNIFPNQAVINAGTEALKQFTDQAKAVLSAAVQLNAKPLLVPDVLPRPTPIPRQRYYERYNAYTVQSGDRVDGSLIRTVLNGTLPPTTEELTQIENAKTNHIQRTYEQRGATGQVENAEQVNAMIADMKAKLPLEEKRTRAQNYAIYVSPGAVETHPGLKDTSPNNLTDVTIFNSQYHLWLQTTVFESIVDANNGAKSVYDAPVKHLVRLTVPINVVDSNNSGMIGFGGQASPEEGAVPADLKPDASAPITPNFAENPLGYTSNSMFDPIKIEMVLRVDYRQLPEVLYRLGRGRFVKIRNVTMIRTVESGVALSQGYLYDRDGRTPLVEVTLECDVLMLREWVVRYMPESVKRGFQALSTPVQPAG